MKPEKTNITFDLETLGLGDNAAVVQIGAVKFDSTGVLDEFLVNIDFDDLMLYDLDIDLKTVYWWLNQESKAIKSVFSCELERYKLADALDMLQEFIGDSDAHNYWSHSSFDPPKLHNLIKKCNLHETPTTLKISYKLFRDIRTLEYLIGDKETTKRDKKLVTHNALDDCIGQAKYINEMLDIIQCANKVDHIYYEGAKDDEDDEGEDDVLDVDEDLDAISVIEKEEEEHHTILTLRLHICGSVYVDGVTYIQASKYVNNCSDFSAKLIRIINIDPTDALDELSSFIGDYGQYDDIIADNFNIRLLQNMVDICHKRLKPTTLDIDNLHFKDNDPIEYDTPLHMHMRRTI